MLIYSPSCWHTCALTDSRGANSQRIAIGCGFFQVSTDCERSDCDFAMRPKPGPAADRLGDCAIARGSPGAQAARLCAAQHVLDAPANTANRRFWPRHPKRFFAWLGRKIAFADQSMRFAG